MLNGDPPASIGGENLPDSRPKPIKFKSKDEPLVTQNSDSFKPYATETEISHQTGDSVEYGVAKPTSRGMMPVVIPVSQPKDSNSSEPADENPSNDERSKNSKYFRPAHMSRPAENDNSQENDSEQKSAAEESTTVENIRYPAAGSEGTARLNPMRPSYAAETEHPASRKAIYTKAQQP